MRPEYIFHSWYHPKYKSPLCTKFLTSSQPSIEKARALDQAGLLHVQINLFSPARHLLSQMRLSSQAINSNYDAGELQPSMATYIGQILGRGEQQFGNFLYHDPSTPPATLNVAFKRSDRNTTPFRKHVKRMLDAPKVCQIIRSRKSSITITGVNMRLLFNTQLNQYHYRLIDSCSLAPAGGSDQLCPRLVRSDTGYYYNFNLGSAKENTLFTGKPRA